MERFLIILVLALCVGLFYETTKTKKCEPEEYLQKCYDIHPSDKWSRHCYNLFINGKINWKDISVDTLSNISN